ncbi:Rha family transcriptional regulator [Salmonella enterica]
MSITVTCPTHHAATVGQQITMSSREIAKLVDSRHSNVCVTIERLMNSGVIGGYAALQYTHPQNGQTYHHYEVNKRDSYVIVAQLSPEFTARLVDRWQELESNGGMIVPRSLPEALRLAADLAEQKHIEAGRFEVKTGTTNQTNYAFDQSRFTAKGVRWIGGLLAEHIAKGQVA